MTVAPGDCIFGNCAWGERICGPADRQPHGMLMLRCSDNVLEVSMFSLIALYFEYRRAQVANVQTGSAARPVRAANDVGANPAVATAA